MFKKRKRATNARESPKESNESTAKKVVRRSSTHSSMDSFVSAESEAKVNEADLDFTRAATYEQIDEIRLKIINQLHIRYTAYDRYIRCPTHYHRSKVIVRDGQNDNVVWE
jgi:hypothetical protein